MKQWSLRTAVLALPLAAVVGAAVLTPTANAATAAQGGHGHDATRAALRAVVESGGLPGAAAHIQDGRARWFAAAGYADTATSRERSAGEHFRGPVSPRRSSRPFSSNWRPRGDCAWTTR